MGFSPVIHAFRKEQENLPEFQRDKPITEVTMDKI